MVKIKSFREKPDINPDLELLRTRISKNSTEFAVSGFNFQDSAPDPTLKCALMFHKILAVLKFTRRK